jgi:hypothetical protein
MAKCSVIGCVDTATHGAVLQNAPDLLPYSAKLCDDHAESDLGCWYAILSKHPLEETQ